MIRMFLKADSPEGLVSLQLQTNVMLKGRADYTDIQFADGFWYAWFLVDIDQNPEVLKSFNGNVVNSSRSGTGKV